GEWPDARMPSRGRGRSISFDFSRREAAGGAQAYLPGSRDLLSVATATQLFLFFVRDYQIILHAENAGDRLCLHFGNLFVHRAVYNAFQLHMAVVDNDSNRRLWVDRVLLQCWMAVYRLRHTQPELVIHRRHRQDFYVID